MQSKTLDKSVGTAPTTTFSSRCSLYSYQAGYDMLRAISISRYHGREIVFHTYGKLILSQQTFVLIKTNIFALYIFRRSKICLGNTYKKLMVSVQKICKRDRNFSSFSFSLYYIIQWLLREAFLEPGRTSARELFCENT